MNIGRIHVDSRLVLAPMAGVTDLAFRQICRELGAGLTVTEMVSAKALCYQDRKTRSLLRLGPGEHPAGVQIFGSDAACMAEAACMAAELSGADFIDINMGCPVGKVVSNGDGSALMKDPEKAARIAEAVVKACPVPVTVKMRRGWDKGSINAVELARMLEQAGCRRWPSTAPHADVRRTGGLGHYPSGEAGGVHPRYRQRRRVLGGGCRGHPPLYRR
ncbi:MAG: tRNA dihydrouridine synthase [Oscillospiraceae bacterium]